MIKLYPDGHFSGLLDDGAIKSGDELELTGPTACSRCATSSPRRLLFIGGGAGMAPILSLLRSMAEAGTSARRSTTTGRAAPSRPVPPRRDRGARRRAARLPLRPGAVGAAEDDGWAGETGLITDVVDRLEDDVTEVDAYLCGPPPMVDAAIALLEAKGVPESHIYFDKFTTTAEQ